MKKLVFTLGLTTVAFAGSTAWLANELRIERARPVPAATLRVVEHAAPPAPVPVSVPKPVVATPVAPEGAAPVAAASKAPPAKEPRAFISRSPSEKEERQAVARDQLSQFTDPAQRAAYVARAIAELRRQFVGLANKAGFTPEEESHLFDLLAQQQARWMEMASRCDLEPSGCDRKIYVQDAEQAKQELVAQLGQDRYDRFVAFRDSATERAQVRELRTRLSAQESLSEAQEDRLAELLSGERKKFVDEAQQRGDLIRGMGTQAGTVTYAEASDGSSSSADRLKSAAEFSRRMRERAMEVLSPRQMETFDQTQEEVLTILREQERRQEIVDSVRRKNAH